LAHRFPQYDNFANFKKVSRIGACHCLAQSIIYNIQDYGWIIGIFIKTFMAAGLTT